MASKALDSRPLLSNFHASDSDIPPKRSTKVSWSSLEDGEASSFQDEELNPQPGFWRRLRISMRRRHGARWNEDFASVRLPGDERESHKKLKVKRRCLTKACVVVPLLAIVSFVVVHILNMLFGFVPITGDDPAASSPDWNILNTGSPDSASHLLDITHDVTPVPCHSHNDYWRQVPLYDALRWGCTGVEADVWLFDEELLVAHDTNALTQNRTFRSMYVDPLVKMLDYRNELGEITTSSDAKNGVFETAPAQTLVLLVDFKNDGHDIFPVVSQHLSALREKGYLTYFDGESVIEGAITVVATGNAPFDLITANSTYRDIFFDAPLDRLYVDPNSSDSDLESSDSPLDVAMVSGGGQGTVGTSPTSHFDSTNSFYASVNFGKSIGWLWFGHISQSQLTLIRGQIRGAHKRGLKARYWAAPKWPIGLRNKVWKVLLEEGVDYLNGDDLQSMARLDRMMKKHWESLS